jgi:NAD(P)-dependent dehydrogenase (short-subunit alcohol dehydrogenase family)
MAADRGGSVRDTRRSVVITGASSGIGLGTTRVLVARGAHVFGSVRRAEDADRLRREFGERVTPLRFDVVDQDAIGAAAQEVRTHLRGRTLWGLVNNAGIAIGGPLLHQPLEEMRRQLEVNVLGAIAVTQAFVPLLGADRSLHGAPGRVVNVSSVAGKIGGPFLGAYVASKHALEGVSESLRRELLLYGIDVIVVGPGHVATPIWDKAEQADASRYAATEYADSLGRFRQRFIARGRRGFPPERIGEVIWRALSARRPRPRYAVVPGGLLNWTLPRLLPARVVDRLIGAALKLRP